MPLENKIKQRLISRIRKEWHWSKEKKECLKKAEYNESYKCALCQSYFEKKQVQVDHIIPVVDPDKGFQGFDIYLRRMFCKVGNLRCLCKPCHKDRA